MSTVATFPRAIERLDPVWIPLKDVTRLVARVWRPIDAEANGLAGSDRPLYDPRVRCSP